MPLSPPVPVSGWTLTSKSHVPPYYDSLLAKLIVHGRDRQESIIRMRLALESFIVEGVKTTIPFLLELLEDPDVVAGNIDTKFLERWMAERAAAS